MDTTVRTPNSFLASNDPTPRAGSYPAWMIKAMEEYAQQKVDLSRKRIESLESKNSEWSKDYNNLNDLLGMKSNQVTNLGKRIEELEALLLECGKKLKWFNDLKRNGIKSMKADDLINSIDNLLNHEHTR